MGFTWTKTIGAGNPNIADAINEVRTNTDAMKDSNDYCATHYVTYNNAVFASNLATHYPTNLATHYTLDRHAHDGGYYGDYHANHNQTYYSYYLNNHNTNDRQTHNGTYQ